MLRRFLLIGVGGSGGKTLRFVHRNITEHLAAAGWRGGMPVGWQFVHVDVPPAPDGNDPQLPPQLPDGCYVPLATTGVGYQELDLALLPPGAPELAYREAVGWRPFPDEVKCDITAGAGQYRTLGRIIALANVRRIRDAMVAAVERLTQPEATTELDRLSVHLGNPPANNPPTPQTIVISSIAGGSGAGIFLDICDVLKSLNRPWLDTSMAVLFAPDVFEDLSDLGKSGVHPNALAALSELLAGYWNGEPAGQSEFALYESAGIRANDVKWRGPRYPFVIGRGNTQVHFGGQLDVYGGTGVALAALVTSAMAQDGLAAYTLGNWTAKTNIDDRLGLKGDFGETPLASLGFASIGLGRDRFGRYAAERLARLAVEHVLRAHWAGRDVPEKMTPEVALEEVRAPSFEWFLADSGLNELGETNNDVLDGIQPPQQAAIIDEAVRDVLTRVTSGRPQLKAFEWATALCDAFNAKEPQLLATLRVAMEARVREEWAPAIQHRLASVVATAISTVGAPVAIALLDTLVDETSKVVGELAQEEEQRRRWAAKRDPGVHNELSAAGTNGQLPSSSEFLVRGVDRARKTLEWAAEAQARGYAGELVRDLRDNVLLPLRRAVAEGIAVLEREDNPLPGTKARQDVREWPQGRIVPRRYEPAVNERLVEPTGDYPGMFEERIARTLDARNVGDAVREAVRQVVLGAEDVDEQQLIVQTSTWVPVALGTATGSASKAAFQARVTADDILGRAREWVFKPNTAIGEYVRESFKRYLDPERVPQADLDERLERFRAAFTEAVDLAAPLVTLDAGVLQRAHNLADAGLWYMFTELPFPEGTRAREVVAGVLRSRKLDPDDARIRGYFGTGEQHRVDIFSMLGAPLEPVVFSSLMGPIAADWTARRTSVESRRVFWRWRRSRPLTRFVPMAPEVRRSFVTGWFVARALGQLRAPDLAGAVEVHVPSRRSWLSFPHPLVAPVASEVDLLPAVLESLPLALLDYATDGVSGDDALVPYQQLVQLGDDPQRSLHKWIVDGTVEAGAPTPPDRIGTAADDAALRRKKVVEYFESRQQRYAKYIDETVDAHSFFELRSVWELRDDLHHTFRELIHIAGATESLEDDGD